MRTRLNLNSEERQSESKRRQHQGHHRIRASPRIQHRSRGIRTRSPTASRSTTFTPLLKHPNIRNLEIRIIVVAKRLHQVRAHAHTSRRSEQVRRTREVPEIVVSIISVWGLMNLLVSHEEVG